MFIGLIKLCRLSVSSWDILIIVRALGVFWQSQQQGAQSYETFSHVYLRTRISRVHDCFSYFTLPFGVRKRSYWFLANRSNYVPSVVFFFIVREKQNKKKTQDRPLFGWMLRMLAFFILFFGIECFPVPSPVVAERASVLLLSDD